MKSKKIEIESLESKIKSVEKNTNEKVNSLNKKVTDLLTCDDCEEVFVDKKEYIDHIELQHKDRLQNKIEMKKFKYLKKLQSLEINNNKQGSNIMKTILKIQVRETEQNLQHNCQGFCIIEHKKRRWVKYTYKSFIAKLSNIEKKEFST